MSATQDECLWHLICFFVLFQWILSHWAHFAVLRFIFVYVYFVFVFITIYYMLCYFDTVRWTWWD